jgi:CheY-like chemotaxis protein
VVLCDLRMAQPSGIEIHDILRQEDPALLERFLFLTGDLSSDEAAAFAERSSSPILKKPFELPELVARVEGLASRERAAI